MATRRIDPKLAVTKRKEGDQLMAQGEKAMQTSLFKWNPDFEVAAASFQKAALAYQLAGLHDNCIKAHKRAAFCHVQTKTEYSAGKALEAAAKVEETRKAFGIATSLYDKAAQHYSNEVYNEKSAEVHIKASKCAEKDNKLSVAVKQLEKALNLYESDEKEYMAIESYKQTAAIYLALEDYKSIFSLFDRLVDIFKKLEQPHNIHSTYLHTIIVLLHTGKGEEANNKLNEFMNASASDFLSSNDFTMASQLIDAVLSDDKDLLAQFIEQHIHNIRERCYGKLIKDMKLLGSINHPTNLLADQLDLDLIIGGDDDFDNVADNYEAPPVVEDDDLL